MNEKKDSEIFLFSVDEMEEAVTRIVRQEIQQLYELLKINLLEPLKD